MKGKVEQSERQKLIEEGIAIGRCFVRSLYICVLLNRFSFVKVLCILHSGKNLKDQLATLDEELVKLKDELQQEAQCMPNMTHPDVPVGGEDCSTIRKMVLLLF